MALTVKAFQVSISTETGDLITDPQSGSITITPIDELMFSLTFGLDANPPLIELVLTQGDASFEVIKADTDVVAELIQLELTSSGSQYLFSLVDRSIDVHRLVISMNSMLETGQVPTLKPAMATSTTTSVPAATTSTSKIGEFAKQLAGMFEIATTKVNPKTILTVDNIMDSVEMEDLATLQQYFPEGYNASKQDLRTIVASSYFKQAVGILGTIMESESAPSFLAQFGLLQHAGDHPVGFAALLRALQFKQQEKQETK